MKSVLNTHWKEWCWRWNSRTLAMWFKELTHFKRPWCWERLKAGGEGNNRGWDDLMASLTQWTWVWANSGNWWWTGRPGMMQSMGLQRVRHNWATELNCTEAWIPMKLWIAFFTELELKKKKLYGKQKTPNRQSNLEKEKWNWRNQYLCFRPDYKAIII